MKTGYRIALSALAAISATAAFADTVKLTPVHSGGMKMVGFYYPQRLALSSTKPAGLKKAPAGLVAPVYGELKMGGKLFIVIVDQPDKGDSKLFVDANGDGDLTNDPATTWKLNHYNGGADGKTEYNQHMGSAAVNDGLGGRNGAASLGMYMFDNNDAQRPQLKNVLLYYADYAYEGQLKLGEKSYHVVLANGPCNGDFTPVGAGDNAPPSSLLLIDVNGNGRFDARGERYDLYKPFNIGGTTYQVVKMAKDGSRFDIVKSDTTVAEILPPPSLVAGAKAISFDAKTTDGKPITFPGSFKGKVVMLDFWATWCGPCMGEVPNVVANYNKYHDKGFEILGISLDNKDTIKQIEPVTKEKGMTWMQVGDGQYWQAAVAQLYVVQSIPQAYLIDGDTGEILAEGESIRGEGLAKAIEAAFAKKAKNGGGHSHR